MNKRISVIIPLHNDRGGLIKCLRALDSNDYDNYEVIIIDDCSNDDPGQVAAEHKHRIVRLPQRAGPAIARQEGIKYVSGEIIAFLDSDCQPEKDWLNKINLYLKEGIDGIGGSYEYEEKKSFFSSFLKYFSRYWFSRWPKDKTDFLLGGNCAYRREALQEDRRGSEQIYFKGIASGDDTLMNLEIAKKHKLSYCPELKVTHAYLSLGDFLKKQLKWGFSRTIISLRFPKEKLWQAKDLPVAQITFQLFATGLFLSALLLFNWHLILTAMFLLLLAHFGPLNYLYSRKRSVLFLLYAFFIFIFRNIAYILGALKGIISLSLSAMRRLSDNLRILLNYLNPLAPSKLNFFITNRCNADCGYCFLGARRNAGQDFPLDEIKKCVRKIGILPYVVLTGGEPFLREDVPEICGLFYRHCLTRYFVIATNGYFTDKIILQAKQILRSSPRVFLTIQVAIDGIGIDHDRRKRLQGSFQQAVATINQLRGLKAVLPNLSVNTSTVITADNSEKLSSMISYLRENCPADNYFITLERCRPKSIEIRHINRENYFSVLDQISNNGFGRCRNLFGKIYGGLYRAVSDEMKQLLQERNYLRPCLAARKFLVIDEEMQLCLCELRDEKAGSIKDAGSVKELLGRRETKELIKGIRREKCFCNWGCAVTGNFVFSSSVYPKMLKIFAEDLLGKRNQ